jgi:translation initiation factor 4G
MHPQGFMHQGQNIGYSPQMGHQLSHQFGNMGIGINPQYSPQQGGKFAGPRKTTPVKITHPDTHEELRLDKKEDDSGSSGARSHSSLPSQSPPVQSFPASHPISYYQSNSPFYQTPSSLPLSSSQITPNTQPPKLNYAASHGPQNVGLTNSSSHNSLPVNKTATSISGNVEPPKREFSHDVPNAISSAMSGASSVSIKPNVGSAVVVSSFANSISGAQKDGSLSSSTTSSDACSFVPPKGSETYSKISSEQSTAEKLISSSLLPSSPALSEDSVPVLSNNEGRKKESLSRSNSLKDNQKKGPLQHQVQKC